ncbi:hypothetical protein NAL19_4509 [Pectobacterium sp. F1-1]|nr:hypothetical protein NAL19_4509 [Pectobacterium sp. F1-1]
MFSVLLIGPPYGGLHGVGVFPCVSCYIIYSIVIDGYVK